MESPLVGILGCGGALGRVVCTVLQPTCRIRGGQRSHPPAWADTAIFQWMPVDVYNAQALADFCKHCEVIVNCTGPSYRIGDRIALAAAEAGACYIDTFGADCLEQSLANHIAGARGVFVLSAGSFPGLSGIFPRWLSMQGFETVDSLHVFAGGREYCSPGAGADLLLSSISGFGIPDAFWRNGSLIRHAEGFPAKVYLAGFKEEVYAQRFFNSETARLAKRLTLREAHWYNVLADKQVVDTISTLCARLTVDTGEAALQNAVKEFAEIASLALSGSSPWYTMMVEIQGRSRGAIVRKRAILRSASSYQLSGVVAAITAEAVLQQKPAHGVYWAFELLDPGVAMEKLLATTAVDSLDVLDIAPVDEFVACTAMEEGIL